MSSLLLIIWGGRAENVGYICRFIVCLLFLNLHKWMYIVRPQKSTILYTHIQAHTFPLKQQLGYFPLLSTRIFFLIVCQLLSWRYWYIGNSMLMIWIIYPQRGKTPVISYNLAVKCTYEKRTLLLRFFSAFWMELLHCSPLKLCKVIQRLKYTTQKKIL